MYKMSAVFLKLIFVIFLGLHPGLLAFWEFGGCLMGLLTLKGFITSHVKTMIILHISVLYVLWPVPCSCAEPYHVGNGNHGQLFHPQPHLDLSL